MVFDCVCERKKKTEISKVSNNNINNNNNI